MTVAAALLPTAAILLTTTRATRSAALRTDAAVILLALGAWAWGTAAGVGIAADLATRILLMVRLAGWVGTALWSGGADLRWSAWRFALIAAAFHLVQLPQVLSVPIDGDEPYYVLMADSIARDGDLDLRNQYGNTGAITGREDLEPQQGDPVGQRGEQRSRHEPFLALLLVPGWVIGGLTGASLTIVLAAALLSWSTIRLLRDLGLEGAGLVAGSALIAFTAPLVSYSVRIWPELPAALMFSEGIRWLLRGRIVAAAPFLLAMSLLKLRFALLAVPLVLLFIAFSAEHRKRAAGLAIAALALILPVTVVWYLTGNPMNVHRADELLLLTPGAISRGLLGMLLDGQSGLLFVVPIVLASMLVLAHRPWPRGEFRIVLWALIPYLLLLAPRAEWHGGWSPPLRYLVVLAPVAAVIVARAWTLQPRSGWLAAAWIASGAVATFAIARPWLQFRIASGESAVGEWLSANWQSDFSRMLPSFLRLNTAAVVAAITLVLLVAALVVTRGRRLPHIAAAPVIAVVLASVAWGGMRPGAVVHFEDAHVQKSGGALDPPYYTLARFLYSGGWRMDTGDELRFRHVGGNAALRYRSPSGAVLLADGVLHDLPPSPEWRYVRVQLSQREEHVLRIIEGNAVLERLDAR